MDPLHLAYTSSMYAWTTWLAVFVLKGMQNIYAANMHITVRAQKDQRGQLNPLR